jgi:hypothetical protein
MATLKNIFKYSYACVLGILFISWIMLIAFIHKMELSYASRTFMIMTAIMATSAIIFCANEYYIYKNKSKSHISPIKLSLTYGIPIILMIIAIIYHLLMIGGLTQVIVNCKSKKRLSFTDNIKGLQMYFTNFSDIKNVDVNRCVRMKKTIATVDVNDVKIDI